MKVLHLFFQGFDRHYNEAFCIVCQHHYGEIQEMKKHQETKEHEKVCCDYSFFRVDYLIYLTIDFIACTLSFTFNQINL